MQIRKIIPSVVENLNTRILFQIWKVDHYFFPTLGIIYFTSSGFIILIYIFPSVGNYF